ncbi:hypothetical protein ACIA5G_20165 [Amycolatopsis sp. NPDC051758]|uniref:hypothetical protein n=1 Tax=Amycolatopsis sp. NPDC051758 TaxID=3363935 RepID=UPI0037A723F8
MLRANLDRFGREHAYADDSVVFLSLVLFRDVHLDGPSVERNLDRLSWTLDIDDGVRIVELDDAETRALYRRGIDLAKHVEPGEAGWNRHRPHAQRDLVAEITDRHWAQSTYWRDLARIIPDELREMKAALDTAFGGRKPFTVNTFIALSRLFYYLALQEQLGSALLLRGGSAATSPGSRRRCCRATSRTRRRRRAGASAGRSDGCGSRPRSRSSGRALTSSSPTGRPGTTRPSTRCSSCSTPPRRRGRLGTPVREKSLKVTVALPFVEPEFTVPVPRLRPKKTGERLLVLMGELLRWS